MGRLVECWDNNGFSNQWSKVYQRFDSLGYVLSSKQEEGLTGTTKTDEIQTKYSLKGRLYELRYPNSGKKVDYSHNQAGLLENILVDSHRIAHIDYFRQRVPLSRSFSNSTKYNFGYDRNKEILQITTINENTNELISGKRFVYNELSMPIRIEDLKEQKFSRIHYDSLYRNVATINGFDSTDPTADPENGEKLEYSFSGNLEQVIGGEFNSFNPTGDFILDVNKKVKSKFNHVNQTMMTSITLTDSTGSSQTTEEEYTYDRYGNLISDGFFNYYYDFKNRLIAVENDNNETFRIYYDALDRRIRKDDVRYLWHRQDMIEEFPDSNDWYKNFFYGEEFGDLIGYNHQTSNSSNFYFAHLSRNGNTEYTTDSSGEITEKYVYDHFGNPIVWDDDDDEVNIDDQIGFSFLKQNQYFDNQLKLFFNGQRCYHPTLRKFMQRDPSGALFDPLTYGNPYTSSANNPIAFSDDGSYAQLIIPTLRSIGTFALRGTITGAISYSVFSYALTGSVSPKGTLISAIFGAISGVWSGGFIWGATGGLTTVTASLTWGQMAGMVAGNLVIGAFEGAAQAEAHGQKIRAGDIISGMALQLIFTGVFNTVGRFKQGWFLYGAPRNKSGESIGGIIGEYGLLGHLKKAIQSRWKDGLIRGGESWNFFSNEWSLWLRPSIEGTNLSWWQRIKGFYVGLGDYKYVMRETLAAVKPKGNAYGIAYHHWFFRNNGKLRNYLESKGWEDATINKIINGRWNLVELPYSLNVYMSKPTAYLGETLGTYIILAMGMTSFRFGVNIGLDIMED